MRAARITTADPRVARVAFVVESESKPGRLYHVALLVGEAGQRDSWSCTCKGHSYRDDCKHARAAQRFLASGRPSGGAA